MGTSLQSVFIVVDFGYLILNYVKLISLNLQIIAVSTLIVHFYSFSFSRNPALKAKGCIIDLDVLKSFVKLIDILYTLTL